MLMSISLEDELFARALGWKVLMYLKIHEDQLLELRKEIDSDALRVLKQIQSILDDDTLDDPECFERIESIVKVFYANNISTSRHDWG